MRKALFIGSACIDVILYLERLPKTEEDIHPGKQVMQLEPALFRRRAEAFSCPLFLLLLHFIRLTADPIFDPDRRPRNAKMH